MLSHLKLLKKLLKFNITLDRSPKAKLSDEEIGLHQHIVYGLALENNLNYINIFEDDIHLRRKC